METLKRTRRVEVIRYRRHIELDEERTPSDVEDVFGAVAVVSVLDEDPTIGSELTPVREQKATLKTRLRKLLRGTKTR